MGEKFCQAQLPLYCRNISRNIFSPVQYKYRHILYAIINTGGKNYLNRGRSVVSVLVPGRRLFTEHNSYVLTESENVHVIWNITSKNWEWAWKWLAIGNFYIICTSHFHWRQLWSLFVRAQGRAAAQARPVDHGRPREPSPPRDGDLPSSDGEFLQIPLHHAQPIGCLETTQNIATITQFP